MNTKIESSCSRQGPRGVKAILGIGLMGFLGGGMLASASSLDFSYSSLANNATDAQIQSFMRTQMSGLGSVTVTGAIASNTYTGDNHAVGPCHLTNSSGACISVTNPITLDDTDGTFIMNNNQTSNSNEIVMAFTGLAQGTYSFSFDLEIFPDAACANGNTCGAGNYPGFDLDVNSVQVASWSALMPGTGGTYPGSPALPHGETAPLASHHQRSAELHGRKQRSGYASVHRLASRDRHRQSGYYSDWFRRRDPIDGAGAGLLRVDHLRPGDALPAEAAALAVKSGVPLRSWWGGPPGPPRCQSRQFS